MSTIPSKVIALLREVYIPGASAGDTRQSLVSALRRVGDARPGRAQPMDTALRELSKCDDFPWVIGAAYWSLRRKEKSLPSGTIFTPPKLAHQVINRLLRGVEVVDLGAGTGMLTLAAAKRGFHVIAIEEDPEMMLVLDALARALKVRDRIDLRVEDALAYSGRSNQQIMANPPYTRHHSIPPDKKKVLSQLASRLGTPLQLTAGHHAYFMIYAWTAKWSEREVLLLPTNWLEARYGHQLRDVMMRRGPREIAILESTDGRPVFDNALTTACLITTQVCSSPGPRSKLTPRIRVVETGNTSINHRGVRARHIARLEKILRPSGHVSLGPGHTLADVFRVKRGVATGSNSFFVLSRASADELAILDKELRPILRRLSPRMLKGQIQHLWIPAKHPSTASLRRVRKGRSLHVHDTYLCKQRQPWWRIAIPDPASYFMSYMGRGQPTIKANARGLLNLNNIHGLYLREGVQRKIGERVVAWLRSRSGIAAMMRCARRYEGGLWKLEPGDVQRLRLPKHLL